MDQISTSLVVDRGSDDKFRRLVGIVRLMMYNKVCDNDDMSMA